MTRKYNTTRSMNSIRQVAIQNGWQYYSGNPCKRGHSGTRLTKDGQCVDCRSILRKKHEDKNRKRARNYELKKIFGMTIEQYNEIFTKQKGLCLLCSKPETVISSRGNLKKLAIDHCHETGKVRGLLCFTCNMGIGYLKHNPEIIYRAAFYCQ